MTSKAHILVVEDDPLVSEVVTSALDDSYRTTLAETSAEAMARVRDGGIDLMLLDCTLPGGLDVQLIPQADKAGIPVILMSGDPARMENLVDQPRPFVLKPFTLATLLAAVGKAIDTRRTSPG
jgi:DNA-binding NtrC family response regulator